MEDLALNLPPKGFGSKMYAYPDAPNQTIINGFPATVKLDHVYYDNLNEFDIIVPTYSFTPKKAGMYLVIGQCIWVQSVNITQCFLYFRNAAGFLVYDYVNLIANRVGSNHVSAILPLVPTEAYYLQAETLGSNKNIVASKAYTFLCIHQLDGILEAGKFA